MSSRKSGRALARILLVLMLVTMPVAFSGPSFAASTAAPAATGKVYASEGAFLRKSASKNSKKVAGLANNTSLVILKEVFVTPAKTALTSRWYYVKAGKNTGYIRADLVKDIKYSSASGVTKSKVNYRIGAGTFMSKKGVFKKGTKVTILLAAKAYGSSKVWYKIKVGTKQFYVASTNIKINVDTTPKFTLANVTYPSNVGEGSPFVLKGTISCTKSMSKIVGGITDASGNWITSVTSDINSQTFNISSIDSKIKFGSLGKGSYIYRVDAYVNGKRYTEISKKFSVIEATTSEKITNTAFNLCWPAGTASSKYKYGTSTGSATAAYTAALDKAYPNRSKWGAAPKVGASCDVFVGTVLRASGVDPDAPRGLDEQIPYYSKSSKYTRISYSGNRSVLKSGDIVLFKRTSGSVHTCIYLVRNGTEYIAEANYTHTYAYIVSDAASIKSKLKTDDKKYIYIYRAN